MKRVAANSPGRALAALAAGYVLILVDQGVTPVITPHLPFDVANSIWLTSVYLVCTVVPMPVAGRLGDRFGQRRIFLIGLSLYVAALVLASLSWSLTSLVVARAVQGLGSAAFLPQAFGMINRIYPSDRRGRAFAVWGVVGSVASLLGPIIGGAAVSVGWRAAFGFEALAGVVALILAAIWLPTLEKSQARIDALSIALSFVGLAALVYGINFLSLWPLLVGIVLLTAFVIKQLRGGEDALVPLRLFSDGNFAAGTFGIVTMGFAVSSMFIPIMWWLQEIAGLSPTQSGFIAAPMSLAAMVLTPYAGRLSDRLIPRLLSAVGFSSMLAGLALAWVLVYSSSHAAWFLVVTLLFGIGSAFVWAPNATTTMRFVPDHAAGAASGLYNTVRQLGSVLGVALVGAVLAAGPIASTAAPAILLPLGAMILGLLSTAFLKPDVKGETG